MNNIFLLSFPCIVWLKLCFKILILSRYLKVEQLPTVLEKKEGCVWFLREKYFIQSKYCQKSAKRITAIKYSVKIFPKYLCIFISCGQTG